jgi:hypothetical protein
MQRHALGILALVLLTVGIVGQGRLDAGATGTCLRVGGVLAILWLAWPQMRGVPLWLAGALGVALVLIMRWPRLLLAALPLAVLLWLLRPRAPRRR